MKTLLSYILSWFALPIFGAPQSAMNEIFTRFPQPYNLFKFGLFFLFGGGFLLSAFATDTPIIDAPFGPSAQPLVNPLY